MDDRTLARLSAFAALAGGGLRIADTFLLGSLDAQTLQVVYFVTDVLLIAALLGLYFPRRLVLGWSGLAAFATAVIGLLIVRSVNVRFFGMGGYAFGAAITLVGITVLGAIMAAKGEQRPASACWLASLAIGIAGSFGGDASLSQAVAGILFGLGFVGAGWTLLRAQGSPDHQAQSAQTATSTVT